MAEKNTQPIIIKKVKKAAHGHHGGAWKVAYADFVTAMMAFFLLLWLLNATTDEQKRGIADYFTPAAVSKSTSGAGALLGGQSISTPGALQNKSAMPSVAVKLRATSGASDGEDELDTGASGAETEGKASEEEIDRAMEEREEERFKQAEEELKQAIQENPDLQSVAENLVVNRTPEGLRIQIVDQEGKAMFPTGSAEMLDRTRALMTKVAQVIQSLPNKISISGHTDATKFRGNKASHGNWELSTGRALSSRRALVEGGIPTDRIANVVGKAETDPLDPKDPASPRNRRISIVLLRDAAAGQAASKGAAKGKSFKRDWNGPRLR
jgi:chemotaxis protein MotB